jgi:hypothetical protein
MRNIALVVAALAAPTMGATIDLVATHFVLSIDVDSCNATMSWKASLAFQPSPLHGTPTAFLSLYNRIADNLPQNMEACRGVSLVRYDAGASSWHLRVAAAHGYGFIDLLAEARGAVRLPAIELATLRTSAPTALRSIPPPAGNRVYGRQFELVARGPG